ncbi:MAG: cytidylate kinase-like family protein [Desulfobacterales bacterium]|nr:cytidylate kinase-like family protein [Desulfobacteraceae bacterium]MDD3991312.1 cytidylate kinase-like family protein [Desulfobacteraceae bacterium]MDY0310635.1 cytidylate kinase-like family protein [Desulfobacterales bacterium]
MAIITISRGSYSRGKEVAEKLAEKLGYACISRDILLEASDEFNIPEIKLIRALHDAPSVLERFRHGKERYVSYLRSALLQHAKKDNLVYHGLAGHYFLRGIPHVLKVRILADIEDRVAEEVKREGISAEKARYILLKDDEERRRWGLQVYGTDTWDSRLYDMVLNIKALTVTDAVEILSSVVAKPCFRTTPEAQKTVDDLALATRVKATLARIAPKLVVTANDSTVFIRNGEEIPTLSEDVIAEIKTTAAGIDGVETVYTEVPEGRPQSDHVNPFHNIG